MTGQELRAVGPSAAGFTGTSRQPSTGMPSSESTVSTRAMDAAKASVLEGRKKAPTPKGSPG